jgi:hypothetical protein
MLRFRIQGLIFIILEIKKCNLKFYDKPIPKYETKYQAQSQSMLTLTTSLISIVAINFKFARIRNRTPCSVIFQIH